jgi:hypothetical protein
MAGRDLDVTYGRSRENAGSSKSQIPNPKQRSKRPNSKTRNQEPRNQNRARRSKDIARQIDVFGALEIEI